MMRYADQAPEPAFTDADGEVARAFIAGQRRLVPGGSCGGCGGRRWNRRAADAILRLLAGPWRPCAMCNADGALPLAEVA